MKGNHTSPKTGKVSEFKSSYELKYMLQLDESVEVVTWEYEPCYVPYIDGTKVRNYIPDFLIESSDGRKIIVEIKPEGLRDTRVNRKKREAVQSKCLEEGWIYHTWEPGEPMLP